MTDTDDGRSMRVAVPGPYLPRVQSVTGIVQHYAWGDHEFIPDLLGPPPDGRPWAELWLGTHPNGPATLADGRPLADGHRTAPLPAQGAGRGRAAVAAGPSDAGHRRGRVRRRALPRPRAEARAALRADPVRGLLRDPSRRRHARRCSTSSAPTSSPRPSRRDGPARRWPRCTAGRFHVDPIVAAAAASERPEARVGRRAWPSATRATPASPRRCCSTTSSWRPARRCSSGPGNLHAYLGGAGVELMGASDNVVRGGLTQKPVDVDDLLAVVDSDAARRPGDGRRPDASR